MSNNTAGVIIIIAFAIWQLLDHWIDRRYK